MLDQISVGSEVAVAMVQIVGVDSLTVQPVNTGRLLQWACPFNGLWLTMSNYYSVVSRRLRGMFRRHCTAGVLLGTHPGKSVGGGRGSPGVNKVKSDVNVVGGTGAPDNVPPVTLHTSPIHSVSYMQTQCQISELNSFKFFDAMVKPEPYYGIWTARVSSSLHGAGGSQRMRPCTYIILHWSESSYIH